MGLLGKLLRAFRPAGKSEEGIQELKPPPKPGMPPRSTSWP